MSHEIKGKPRLSATARRASAAGIWGSQPCTRGWAGRVLSIHPETGQPRRCLTWEPSIQWRRDICLIIPTGSLPRSWVISRSSLARAGSVPSLQPLLPSVSPWSVLGRVGSFLRPPLCHWFPYSLASLPCFPFQHWVSAQCACKADHSQVLKREGRPQHEWTDGSCWTLRWGKPSSPPFRAGIEILLWYFKPLIRQRFPVLSEQHTLFFPVLC